jgi:hypothetical protein
MTRTILLTFVIGSLACAPQAVSSTAEGPATPASTAVGAGPLERFKAVTGGDRWDTVTTIETSGKAAAGGLTGPVTTLQDVSTGRSVSHYTLGPVSGAEGFDGVVGWEQDPGGEVSAKDAPEAQQSTRAEAWLNALGYWYPARAPATFGPPQSRDENGARYDVIDAMPRGAHPLTLWFDAKTGLLARTVERKGPDTVTTVLDDYRDAGGVRMPFHTTSDRTDAAGRTDPRDRTEVWVDRVALDAPAPASAFAKPEMATGARVVEASGVTQVPFELVNNHIYVSASVDGKPVRMMVDTGGMNLLTPTSAARLGIAGEGKLGARGVGDDAVDLSIAHAGEVRLGGAVLSHPVFYLIDMGNLGSVEGLDVDGLVGYEMFRRLRVSIDYAAHVLTLTEPAKFQPLPGSHVVPFEMADRMPIVRGTLDGQPVRLSVDTGSRASLTLNSPFVREHDLAAKYSAAPETVTGWGVGGAARGRPARLGALTLGDVTVLDVAADLHTGDKGSFANPDLSGNLGGGVLRRFTVAFDYDASRMYLVPNADFGKPDAFDRSGMFLVKDGDALKVVALSPGGPAEKAGLSLGDHVESIGREAVSHHSLAEWRARLRETPAGTHIALRLSTSGRTIDLVLADAIPAHARVH